MITKAFQKGDAASEAVYSDCLAYRYSLTRIWDRAGPRLLYIMLNPSKATERQNDPTVERCERRARVLGYGAIRVEGVAWADTVIAGWGVHGEHLGRGAVVAALLRGAGREVRCLGLSKAGHPRHPLYIAYATQPVVWAIDEAGEGRQAAAKKGA